MMQIIPYGSRGLALKDGSKILARAGWASCAGWTLRAENFCWVAKREEGPPYIPENPQLWIVSGRDVAKRRLEEIADGANNTHSKIK